MFSATLSASLVHLLGLPVMAMDSRASAAASASSLFRQKRFPDLMTGELPDGDSVTRRVGRILKYVAGGRGAFDRRSKWPNGGFTGAVLMTQ